MQIPENFVFIKGGSELSSDVTDWLEKNNIETN